MAPGSLLDQLSVLPQFQQNATAQAANGGQNSGGANVNLRAAGTNRTLTLLDGRRVVPSNRFGTVDVNMFPDLLVRSVETVTGGASASYGTDAVAGVANFLLDTKFEGFKANLQGGQTARADGRNWQGGFAFGHAFFNDRFHLIASAQAANNDTIKSLDSLRSRPWYNQTSLVTNPNGPLFGGTGPDEIIRHYVVPTDFSNQGIIVEPNYPAINRLQFNPDGSLSLINFSGVGSLSGGCNCYSTPIETYGVDADKQVQTGTRRSNAFVHAAFDVTDTTEIFLEGISGKTRNSDARESISLLQGWQGRIYLDNAYLTDATRTLLASAIPNRPTDANGAGGRYFAFGFLAPNDPNSPLGESRQITDNNMQTGTLGFKTTFGDGAGLLADWRMNGYYTYGRNVQDFIAVNSVRVDRLFMAMDAVEGVNGQPICRVADPRYAPDTYQLFQRCQPINLFGGLQNVTPAAADWIMNRHDKVARQITDMNAAELVLDGNVWHGFGAGPVSMAVGAAFRKETLAQRTLDPSDEYPALPDGTLISDLISTVNPALRGLVPEVTTSAVYAGAGIPGLRFVSAGYLGDANSSSVLFSSLRTIAGQGHVTEAFTEFQIPVLKDKPFARNLDFNAAARFADYSASGGIWAWKVGTSWAFNDSLRFRATQSRDVRAPTLRELYDQTRGGITVQDPLNNNTRISAASLSGGNENAKPETASTTTMGFVFTPTFMQSFTGSVDWYSIDISDALAQLTAQDIVNGCYVRNDDTLCQYVIRQPTVNGLVGTIDRVESVFINVATQKISGVDLELGYRRPITLFGGGPEALGLRVFANYADHNSLQNRGAAVDERVGQWNYPRYRISGNVTYANGPFSMFVQGRWTVGGLLDRNKVQSDVDYSITNANGTVTPVNTLDRNWVGSIFLLDTNLRLNIGESANTNVYFNVQNLLDRWPQYAPGGIGRTGTTPPTGDVVGRRFVLGINYRF
jgi:outer membrane receptor protein involved in Fe transport